MIQRQYGGVFYFLQHKAGARVHHARVCQEGIEDELGEAFHICEKSVQHIVGFAGEREAAQHLRPIAYGVGKAIAQVSALIYGYADKHL